MQTERLGLLALKVSSRKETDVSLNDLTESLDETSEGAVDYSDDLFTADAAAEELPEDLREEADVVASAAKAWSPTYGKAWTYNAGTATLPRRILQTLTWTSQNSVDSLGSKAYEHDFKLINRGNPGANGPAFRHPSCFGWGNNFWAVRKGVFWRTNFPRSAKPYFDTEVSDSCESRDFTIGLYHPAQLQARKKYETIIRAKPGENSSSPYQMYGQKLGTVCDDHPACVNPTSRGGESQLLVGEGKGRAPECRRWRKGRRSRACF